ncbi:MAG: hypothetical protein ACXABY_00085 [Candidatus Thorarchaeota archaeon]|jgi:hypothetical protein
MTLRVQTFYLDKKQQGILREPTRALIDAVGVEGDFLEKLELVNFGDSILQLNLVYNTSYDRPILSTSIPPGAIISSGVDPEHISILFSDRIDTSTVVASSFTFDGADVGGSATVITEDDEDIIRVDLPGTAVNNGDHTIGIDSASIKYQNGSFIQHSDVVGYTVNSLAKSASGQSRIYTAELSRRGDIVIEGLRVDKSIVPSERIDKYLQELGITSDKLIEVSAMDISPSLVYIIVAYYKTLEPQLVATYPYNHSLVVSGAVPSELVFVFKDEVDPKYLTTTSGVFSYITGFSIVNAVASSDVTVDADNKVVRVSTSNIIVDNGIYDIRIGTVYSLEGIASTRDILYSVLVLAYSVGGAGGAPVGAPYVLVGANDSDLTADRVLTAGTGIGLGDAGANSTITVNVDEPSLNHNSLLNTHNLTTDIDHSTITNTHNLTTDIDHDQLTNTHDLTASINHNLLTNYNSDEHTDHTAVTLTAGLGQSGGGDISASRTFDVNFHPLTLAPITDVDFVGFHDESAAASRKITFSDFQSGTWHSNLQEVGTNTHAQIDTHIANGDVHTVKNNFSEGAGDPGGAGESEGYSIGSLWLNTTTPALFICIDPTDGSENWDEITIT